MKSQDYLLLVFLALVGLIAARLISDVLKGAGVKLL